MPAETPLRQPPPVPVPAAAEEAASPRTQLVTPQQRGGGLVAPRLDLRRLNHRIAEIDAAGVPPQQREGELLKLLAALTSAAAVILYDITAEGPKAAHRLIAGQAQAELPRVEPTLGTLVRRAQESETAELEVGPEFASMAVRLQGEAAVRVLTLVLQLRRQPPEPFLAVLQLFAALLSADPAKSRVAAGQAAALELAQQVAKARPSAPIALADGLRHVSGARSVAVCRLLDGERARLEAFTGADTLDRRARLPQTLEAAALLVAGSGVLERHRPGASAGAAFEQLLGLLHAQEMVSLPIGSPPSAVALLAFDSPDEGAATRLHPLLPSLPVIEPLLRRAPRVRPRLPRWRLVLGVGLVAAAALMFLPVPHRLSAPLTLVPESRRIITAPFDGILAESLVERGERVAAGSLLARLEDRELRLELERLTAEAERVSRERDMALSLGKATEAELKRLEYERARLAAEVVAQRLARVEIVSPIDGIVTSDELDQAIGAPVRSGDSLFEVAPLEVLTGEIALPANSITYLPETAEATLYLDAFPGWELTLPIERVSPKATVQDGTNVFVLEVTLENGEGRLLPGLRGEVRIDAGEASLGWVLFHEAWERLARWLR